MKTYMCRLFLAAALAAAAVSCTNEPDTNADSENGETFGEGEGMVSVVLYADKMNNTRVGEGDYNTPLNIAEEDRIKYVRVILYDMTGEARYIKDLTVTYGNQDDKQWITPHQPPVYRTKAFKVEKRKYRVAVLVNYKNEWKLYADQADADLTDIDHRTCLPGHSASVLTDMPLDFAHNGGSAQVSDYYTGETVTVNNYRSKTYYMQTLAGVFDTRPSYVAGIAPDVLSDDAHFFMSNADGLVEVGLDQIRETAAAAENAPVTVRVERALAKVAFFMSEDVETPDDMEFYMIQRLMSSSDNALTRGDDNNTDAVWRVDAHNTKVYPIRKHNNIAPHPAFGGAGGSMEGSATDRRDRYARDPNYTGASTANFFYVGADGSDPMYGDGSLVETPYMDFNDVVVVGNMDDRYIDGSDFIQDPLYYNYLEYVSENTMAPANLDTRYTTNVLLRITLAFRYYHDQAVNVARGGFGNLRVRTSYTYFRLDDVMYPFDVVGDWLYGEPVWGNEVFYDMKMNEFTRTDLEAAGFSAAEIQRIKDLVDNGYNGTVTSASTGARLSYYRHGYNYYRVPIRHFTDLQSPDLNTGYGRYGVVRNNTYLLMLKAIRGFGEPTIPEPGQFTEDAKKYLSIRTGVYDWFTHLQYEELGNW